MRFVCLTGAALIAVALSGCGYKPLDAPCSMTEGGAPAVMERDSKINRRKRKKPKE
jgi:hypothetical protein